MNDQPMEIRGIKDGILLCLPIAIGYIPIAITFGVIAQSSGLSLIQALAMSIFVFAGSSQFVAVKLLSLGIPFAEIILTTFMLNFRHFLMSSSLMTKFFPMPKRMLALVGFGITDETFAIASLQNGKLTTRFMLGLNFTAYAAWTSGTAIGVLLASGMPPILQASMAIGIYAMFIGLLVPSMKKSLKIALIAATAGLTNYLLQLFLTIGWSIIFATLLAALLGSLLSGRKHS